MANHLDQIFQKKLRLREFTPKDGDWASVESLLNTPSINPPPSGISLNWIYTGIIITLIGIGIYVGVNSKIPLKNGETQMINNKESNSEFSTITNSVSHQDLPKSESSPQESIEDELGFKGETVMNTINSEKGSKSSINSSSISHLKNSNSTKKSEGKTEENTTKTNSEKEKKSVENSVRMASYAGSTNLSSNSFEETSSTSHKFKNQQTNDYSSFESTSYHKSDSRNLQGKFNKAELNYTHLYLISTPVQSIDVDQRQQSIIHTSNQNETTQLIKPIKPKRNLPIQLSIAAFGEISYLTKKIKGDDEFSSLIAIRNSEEKAIISSGIGIETQANYKDFGISTGISLNHWGENIQYEEKYTSDWEVSSVEVGDTLWTEDIIFTYDSIINPIDSSSYIIFIVDSSFVTVVDSIYYNTVYDSTLVESEIGLSSQNGRTSIQYWEIPLYFSYKFDVGDFYLSPGVGVTIGFLKVTKGYYMGEDLMSLIPINTQYAVFKKTIVNGLINLGIGYRIGKSYSIEITPSYRFNLTNILDNPGMIQKYSSISLQFRLRYYF